MGRDPSKCSRHAGRAFAISLGMQEFHNLEYLSWKGPCTSFNLLCPVTDGKTDGRDPSVDKLQLRGRAGLSSHSYSIKTHRGGLGHGPGPGQRQREQQWWVRNIGGCWGASPLSVMTVNISTRILLSMEGSCEIITLGWQHMWANLATRTYAHLN